jgi:hypothetical protein
MDQAFVEAKEVQLVNTDFQAVVVVEEVLYSW